LVLGEVWVVDFKSQVLKFLQAAVGEYCVIIPNHVITVNINSNTGVRKANTTDKTLYFGIVEPSIKSSNSSNDMCLMPDWAFEILNLSIYGDTIDIVNIIDGKHIKNLGYIKIKGSISTYVEWDNLRERIKFKFFDCYDYS
jgi:hypothetical protein